MKRWGVRPLTDGERRLATDVFGAELAADRVRIWSPPVPKPLRSRPFVPGRLPWPARDLIIWSRAPLDFTAPEVSVVTRSVFVHELTHVWQSQRGVNLLFAKLRAGDRAASYQYVLETGSAWAARRGDDRAHLGGQAVQPHARAPHDQADEQAAPDLAPAQALAARPAAQAARPHPRDGDRRRRQRAHREEDDQGPPLATRNGLRATSASSTSSRHS